MAVCSNWYLEPPKNLQEPLKNPQEPHKNPKRTLKELLKNLQKNLKITAKLQTSTPKEPCACFVKNTRFLNFSFWHCHPYRQVWNNFCEPYWPLPNRWKLVRDDVNTASLCLMSSVLSLTAEVLCELPLENVAFRWMWIVTPSVETFVERVLK